uniref:Uncharacterized protein LOC111117896 n=1 Tax=Crassostrea virginica TaxID=6565 RepID=A0A8B8CE03_CRAVI|nr:uncharacterized protein LOC111117896 [Crassostrea virginica]
MNLALLSIVISAASACLSSGDVDRCDDERQFFTTPNLMTRMLVLRRLTTRSDFRDFPLLQRLIIFTSELNCEDVYVNPWVTVRLNGVTCKNTQPSITTRLFTTMATTLVNGTTTTAMIVFVKPWIYGIGVSTGILGIICITACIICLRKRPQRVQLDGESINEFDAIVMRNFKSE